MKASEYDKKQQEEIDKLSTIQTRAREELLTIKSNAKRLKDAQQEEIKKLSGKQEKAREELHGVKTVAEQLKEKQQELLKFKKDYGKTKIIITGILL